MTDERKEILSAFENNESSPSLKTILCGSNVALLLILMGEIMESSLDFDDASKVGTSSTFIGLGHLAEERIGSVGRMCAASLPPAPASLPS